MAPTTGMSLQSPRHAGKRHGDRLVELVRYKTIIGEKLRARHPESQVAEAITAGNILNRLAGSLPIGERLRTIVADCVFSKFIRDLRRVDRRAAGFAPGISVVIAADARQSDYLGAIRGS